MLKQCVLEGNAEHLWLKLPQQLASHGRQTISWAWLVAWQRWSEMWPQCLHWGGGEKVGCDVTCGYEDVCIESHAWIHVFEATEGGISLRPQTWNKVAVRQTLKRCLPKNIFIEHSGSVGCVCHLLLQLELAPRLTYCRTKSSVFTTCTSAGPVGSRPWKLIQAIPGRPRWFQDSKWTSVSQRDRLGLVKLPCLFTDHVSYKNMGGVHRQAQAACACSGGAGKQNHSGSTVAGHCWAWSQSGPGPGFFKNNGLGQLTMHMAGRWKPATKVYQGVNTLNLEQHTSKKTFYPT